MLAVGLPQSTMFQQWMVKVVQTLLIRRGGKMKGIVFRINDDLLGER
jgi:hypothetical protein